MPSALHPDQQEQLLNTLKARFDKFKVRHKNLNWDLIKEKLIQHPDKLSSVYAMEETGGEPDIIGFDESTGLYTICDCSSESPKGRRSLCYDREGLESRKEHKPKNSAIDMAREMGIELMTEEQYHILQKLGPFDTKTSSWLKTPDEIRSLGGAIFADFRYGKVFVYHNSAPSYYSSRGFRGILYL